MRDLSLKIIPLLRQQHDDCQHQANHFFATAEDFAANPPAALAPAAAAAGVAATAATAVAAAAAAGGLAAAGARAANDVAKVSVRKNLVVRMFFFSLVCVPTGLLLRVWTFFVNALTCVANSF